MEEINYGNWVPYKAPGTPVSVDELGNAALEYTKRVSNVNAYANNVEEAYDRVNDEVFAVTGKTLDNPFRVYRTTAMGRRGPDQDLVEQWRSELDGLAKQHPDAFDWEALKFRPAADASKMMKGAEERLSAATESRGLVDRAGIGMRYVPLIGDAAAFGVNLVKDPAGTLTQFNAMLYGSASSPVDTLVNVLSGMTGLASKSLVKNAVQNGLVNAGAQTLLEPAVQMNRAAGGLDYGIGHALDNIAGAFGTGAALDLAFRPAGRAAIRRFGTDTPEGVFSRNEPRGGWITDAPENLNLPKPQPKAPDIAPEVIERARNDDVTALREIAEKTGIMDQPGVKAAFDYAELGGKVDEAAIERFRQMGVDTGEGMRTLAEVMKDPDRYIRMPDPIRPAEAPLMREEAVRLIETHAGELDQLMSRSAKVFDRIDPRLMQYIDRAIEAGFGDVVSLTKKAVEDLANGRGLRAVSKEFQDAVIALADARGLESLADKAVIHGSNNLLEVVDALRRSPDQMDSNVPVTTDFMRGARALATLDPEAYAVVRSGALPPSVGAEIANRVPLDRQAEIAGALRDAGVTSTAEARPLIDDLLPSQSPKDDMPLHGGAKVTDPAGPEAKAQTDRLREEHADAIKEAEAPLKERDKVADQVETLKGEIVKLEEKLAGGGEAKPKEGGPFDPFQTLDGEPSKTDVPEAKAFAELAAKREELRAAELELAARNQELIPGVVSPLFRFVAERAEMQREVDLHTAIGDALRLADRVLPEDARVTVTAQRLVVDGFELDAMERAGDITLALHAVDPAARIGHEGVHALVSRGLLSPAEVDLLARAAAEADIFKDEAKYREAYKDRANLDRLIAEEAAAHYVEARIKDQAPEVKSITDHVRALIERVKNALEGYGFKTAEDIRNAVLRGDVARRSARQEWMRRNDVTAVASDGDRMAAFAGEKALTADRAQWARAQLMEAAGKSRDDIWTETGWFRGVDGKWRFEIDDRRMRFVEGLGNDNGGMGLRGEDAVLHHPDLVAAYPQTDKLFIDYLPSDAPRSGSYNSMVGDIQIRGRDGLKTAGHELQHAVQNYEAFAGGGTLNTLRAELEQAARDKYIPTVEELRAKAAAGLSAERAENQAAAIASRMADNAGLFDILFGRREKYRATALGHMRRAIEISKDVAGLQRQVDDLLERANAAAKDAETRGAAFGEAHYARLAGEVEARTVEKRLPLTDEQRRARPPWLDYDIPEDQQIVRYANGTSVSEKAFSEEPPVPGHPTVRNLTMYAIRAFHGSPHDFERFDLSKIGTGEGAQAYGHGLYFAESEGVARYYQQELVDPLTRFTLDGRPLTQAEMNAYLNVQGDGGNPARTLQNIKNEIGDESRGLVGEIASLRQELAEQRSKIDKLWPWERLSKGGSMESDAARLQADIDSLGALLATTQDRRRTLQAMIEDGAFDRIKGINEGHFYEVRINAEPEQFLDWDKPLSQQSETVRKMAKSAYDKYGDHYIPPPDHTAEWTGGDIHASIARAARGEEPGFLGSGKKEPVAEMLRDAGIPGIRYLDQGSRGEGKGTYNYVVFDDKLIEITAKNGEPLTPAARKQVVDALTAQDDAQPMFALSGVRRGADIIDPERVTLLRKSAQAVGAVDQISQFIGDVKGHGLQTARDLKTQRRAGTPDGSPYTVALYDITVDGKRFGDLRAIVSGDTAYIDWIGNAERTQDGSFASAATLGVRVLRKIRDDFRKDYPEVKRFIGDRISGSRMSGGAQDKSQSVMFALRDEPAPERIRAYHGTTSDFAEFLPQASSHVGPHFGPAEMARQFSRGFGPDPTPGGRTIPVDISVRRMLVAPDDGPLDARSLLRGIREGYISGHTFAEADVARIADVMEKIRARGGNLDDENAAMRSWLVSHGIDAITFDGDIDGPGQVIVPVRRGIVTSAITGDTMFALRPDPPRPPLHAEVAMIDRMGMLKDLAMACRG